MCLVSRLLASPRRRCPGRWGRCGRQPRRWRPASWRAAICATSSLVSWPLGRAWASTGSVKKDLSDAESGGVQPQGAAHAVGRRRVEARQDLHGAARSPESGHRLEAGEGQDRLGLVAGVPVAALGVLQGRAGLVLAGVSVGGLIQAGVYLGGQRPLGGDDREQVGQPGAEAPHDVLAREALGGGPESMSAAGLAPSARRVRPAGWVLYRASAQGSSSGWLLSSSGVAVLDPQSWRWRAGPGDSKGFHRRTPHSPQPLQERRKGSQLGTGGHGRGGEKVPAWVFIGP